VVVAFVEQVRRLLVLPSQDVSDSFQFATAELDPLTPTLKEGWVRPPAPPNDLYFVAVLRPLSVDRTMFDRARSQLIADELIAAVRSRYSALARNPRARVIAITAQDMYIKARRDTWRFALSLRSKENSVAVVSCARMDSAYLGHTPDEELQRSRLRKMVTKNIGVLYGNVLGLDDLDYMSEFFEPRQ
jgi:hypothetical protein